MSDPKNTDRDQQILNRLARIEHKVDSIEQTNAFALRAEAEKHFASIKAVFRNSKRKAQVYLAADGERSVGEIAAYLGIPRQNVSPALRTLHEEGLLELVASIGGSDIWGKKPIDRSLRVTKFLCEEYSLTKEGKQAKGAKTAKRARGRK